MFHVRNAVRIAEYLLLSALTLSTGCLAAEKVQISDNHKEVVSRFSSRSLLDVWDDYNKAVDRSNRQAIFYFLGFTGFSIIVLTCFCCMRRGCKASENETLPETVLHAPPRTAGTVVPPPSNYWSSPGYSSNLGMASSGSSLVPPRTSRSIILPYEGETFPSHLYGIDNPNYQPINAEQYFNVIPIPEPPRQNQTPLCDIMEMPPPYDTVVKEDFQYPKTTSKS